MSGGIYVLEHKLISFTAHTKNVWIHCTWPERELLEHLIQDVVGIINIKLYVSPFPDSPFYFYFKSLLYSWFGCCSTTIFL